MLEGLHVTNQWVLGYYSSSWMTAGYGNNWGGFFQNGSWVVELYLDGVLIANGEFDVY